MMLSKITLIGLAAALAFAPQHRNTLNRQKGRATAEHARQVRAATNK